MGHIGFVGVGMAYNRSLIFLEIVMQDSSLDEAKKYASHEEGLVAQKASLEAEASRSSKSREKLVALERKRVELEMSTRYGSSVNDMDMIELALSDLTSLSSGVVEGDREETADLV
ncbi:hypothetical protein Bca52824_074714 [Brassica carinata]|uniref:Uncharacterized protein n=1 Tax=Brassica carinata TaxID=52824 RepID=A0A8X7TUR2_BRACI|nr:hypothetical protein Bca52824_074714 [Brassica carinata]